MPFRPLGYQLIGIDLLRFRDELSTEGGVLGLDLSVGGPDRGDRHAGSPGATRHAAAPRGRTNSVIFVSSIAIFLQGSL
jgi:hypothetical protein